MTEFWGIGFDGIVSKQIPGIQNITNQSDMKNISYLNFSPVEGFSVFGTEIQMRETGRAPSVWVLVEMDAETKAAAYCNAIFADP